MITPSVPSTPPAGRPAGGALALAAAGALFVLYPAVRPYGDRTEAGAAAAFASPWWLVAHLAAVAGFVLAGFGLLALRDRLAGTPGERAARLALGTWAVGAGMVLPYYGAESFALNALGAATVERLPELAEAVRMGPVQITLFGVGLVALGGGAVLAAVAAGRSGLLARRSGWAFAAGSLLLLPQFFLDPSMRIAHGVLLGAGCLVLANAVRGAGRPRAVPPGQRLVSGSAGDPAAPGHAA